MRELLIERIKHYLGAYGDGDRCLVGSMRWEGLAKRIYEMQYGTPPGKGALKSFTFNSIDFKKFSDTELLQILERTIMRYSVQM